MKIQDLDQLCQLCSVFNDSNKIRNRVEINKLRNSFIFIIDQKSKLCDECFNELNRFHLFTERCVKVAEFFEYLRSLEVDLPKLEDARKDFGIIIPKTENEDFTVVAIETIPLSDEKPQPTSSNQYTGGKIEEIYIKLEKEEVENREIDVSCDNNLHKSDELKDESDDEDDKSLVNEIDETDTDHDESNSLRLRNKSIVKVESKEKKRKTRSKKLKSDDDSDEDYAPDNGPSKPKKNKINNIDENERKLTKAEKRKIYYLEEKKESKMREKIKSENYLDYLINLEHALKAIKVNKEKIRHVCKKYKILDKTLRRNLSNEKFKEPPKKIFTDEQEQEMIDWLLEENMKKPIKANKFLKHANKLVKQFKIEMERKILKNDWLDSFVDRNKDKIREEYRKHLIQASPKIPDLLEVKLKSLNVDGIMNSMKEKLDFLKNANRKWMNLEIALKYVAARSCPVIAASNRFGIPRTVLSRILQSYNIEVEAPVVAILQNFSEEQEQEIVDWVLNYPDKSKLTKAKLQIHVNECAEQNGFELSTKLGKKRFNALWATKFVDRHTEKLGEDLTNRLRFHIKGIDPEEDRRLENERVKKRNYHGFTPEDMKKALELVNSKLYNPVNAAKMFNIPRTTFYRYVEMNREGINIEEIRKWMIFSMKQERHIVNWILERNQILPVTCEELRNYGIDYAHQNGIKLMGARVSTKWIVYFIRRHNLKIGHLKDQLLSNRRVESSEILHVEPYDMDSDNQVDGDSSDNEELDIDESEIPIVTNFFCHLCGINLQMKDEILKHKDDHKKGKIISNQFKKNI